MNTQNRLSCAVKLNLLNPYTVVFVQTRAKTTPRRGVYDLCRSCSGFGFLPRNKRFPGSKQEKPRPRFASPFWETRGVVAEKKG